MNMYVVTSWTKKIEVIFWKPLILELIIQPILRKTLLKKIVRELFPMKKFAYKQGIGVSSRHYCTCTVHFEQKHYGQNIAVSSLYN
jgi:hypothetical protein